MDIPPNFSVVMRLGEMAGFEIFELFLSEKQNRGMLLECPSPHRETAMAERSRNSRPTPGFRAKQSGAVELRRRLANSPPTNEGGNYPPRKALKTQKTRKESRRGGGSSPTLAAPVPRLPGNGAATA
jgi:hypothetical protein